MNCPSCGHPNPEDARFCGDCGGALKEVDACPTCGAVNPRGQRFCHGCGQRLADRAPPAPNPVRYTPADLAEKMAASAAALAGERKQVTVLFLDVQDSMELAESLDSEVWRAVMDRFLATVCDGVHRYEGTVNKFTGDGAMVLFGAPIAHEDHARRACYAALTLRDTLDELGHDLRREHGIGFSVRMGLNSGDVVVGAVGDDLHLEYTAIGNTVGLAARMEALAYPGKPYLTRATASLVEGFFELEDIGELRVKGVPEPVHAYALVRSGSARTRLDAAAARGLSRFIGRERELDVLAAALERAGDGGQVVGIVGEPGVGKSRVCHEFAERCRDRGIQVTTGAAVAHGRRIPLLPVIDMLRGYFGIADEDDPRAAREKVAGRLLLLDDAFREALPILFDFLGVADPDRLPPRISPEGRQRTLFAAVRRLVQAGAEDGARVILVEDLHWLDPGSEAFLRNLVDSLPGGRTLLVANFRPEYHADWMQKPYYQPLPLAPLDEEAIAALVQSLVGDDPSLDGVASLVSERTGGNPFFVEEVVHGLVETAVLAGAPGAYRLVREIHDIEIPPTVHAVLAARIDRLGEHEKAALQAAAVIGREFGEPVLREISGMPEHELATVLDSLCAADLLYERALYPEAQYAFKHPLTEEVAYRSQLERTRAERHAAVARALERLYPDRLDELAALLSSHWERADEQLAAAPWSARAAAWAGQAHPADALRHWLHVRTLLRDQPPSAETRGLALAACLWTLQFGWRLGLPDHQINEVYRHARELADALGSGWGQAAAVAAYGVARGMVGGVQEALDAASTARALADEAGDVELAMSSGLAYWLAIAGRTPEALEEIERAIDLVAGDVTIGRQTLGFSALIWGIFFRGIVLADLGRLNEAGAALAEGVRLAREHKDVENLGWAISNHAALALFTGEPGDSLGRARAGFEIAERLGSVFSQVTAYYGLACAHLVREEWEDALVVTEEQLAQMRSTRTGLQYEADSLCLAADALLGFGAVDDARQLAAEAVEIAARRGQRVVEARSRWRLGRALAATRPSEARRELEAALQLCSDSGLYLIPHVREALADLVARQGLEDERRRELDEAVRLYEAHGATGHARRVAAELEAFTA